MGPAAVRRRGLGIRGPAGLLALGAIVNFASSSPWERFGWGPLALLLAIGCVVLARSRATPPSA